MNLVPFVPKREDLFYIKNKDTVLAEIGISDVGLISLISDYGLPSFIVNRLSDWVQSRGFYKHRAHLQETLEHFNLITFKDVIEFSKGISLNDTLWIVKSKDHDLKWSDYSPFVNEFNPIIEQLMWDGGIAIDTLSSTKFSSGELANDGVLPKCWHRDEDREIYLYKASRYKSGKKANEPLSELLCSQVLDKLRFNHAKYNLVYFKDRYASRCKSFTTERIMLVKATHMFGEETSSETVLKKLIKLGFEEQVKELVLFDSLVYNTDRHKSNYGLVLDADTFDVLGLSPIYDNGFGLFPYWTPDMCNLDSFAVRCPCKMFISFEAGVEWLLSIGQSIDILEKMLTFKFDRTGTENYDQLRITSIEHWLVKHALKLLNTNSI